MNLDQLEHKFISRGEVRLHYVEGGSGPLVVLLHGFPEFWYSWRNQIPTLIKAGYRVIAPDMRGYNLSSKPRGVKSYREAELIKDVEGLVKGCGEEKAFVIGHDWGAAVAWAFAGEYPEMLERLVILNVPHPERTAKLIWTWPQILRSAYIFFFQLPVLPELVFQLKNYQILRQTFDKEPVNRGAFTAGDIEKYVEAFSQPGAVRAAINYYRAAFRQALLITGRLRLKQIKKPVLIIWGQQDIHLGREMAEPKARWVSDYRLKRVWNASHFVQNDQSGEVNRLILEFLAGD